jgi:ATP-binding cassette subfamily C protein
MEPFKRILKVLSRQDLSKLIWVIIFQSALGILDLIGVALFGVLGALSITGISSNTTGNRVNFVLELLHIDSYSFQTQVSILAVLASLILVLRTIISIIVTKRVLKFISSRGAALTSLLTRKLFLSRLDNINRYTEQETLYGTITGVQSVTLGVIGTSITIISDTSLLIILTIGLLVIDPKFTSVILVFFVLMGFMLHKYMAKKSFEIGTQESDLGVKSNQKIVELRNTYREITVKNLTDTYVTDISSLRYRLADILAEKTFMPNVSKYVLETAVIVGALIIGGFQFTFQDATHATASLSVFLAAGTRIAPAVLRIQQGVIVVKNSLGASALTLDMLETLPGDDLNFGTGIPDFKYDGFLGSISLMGVNFQYQNSKEPALTDINIEIEAGSKIALVGPSGSGKSTLVDLILGMYTPKSGEILISGCRPLHAFGKWPGAVAYVPQETTIILGTIRDNLSLGLNHEFYSEIDYWNSLEFAQLSDFVRSLPLNLDSFVGDEGFQLSGGQRQRLGIARALMTKPHILILDEATSALDVETEDAISNLVEALSTTTTVITIAHRISSIRNADNIYYMSDGKILANGEFDQLRQKVPGFDRQAGLMGL